MNENKEGFIPDLYNGNRKPGDRNLRQQYDMSYKNCKLFAKQANKNFGTEFINNRGLRERMTKARIEKRNKK